MQLFRKLASDRWAIAFLTLLPFIFYFNWFSWFQTHFWTYGDGEYSYISYRKALIDAWSSFSLPFWNEFINLGLPLASDPQAESLYPLNLLYLFFPFPVALNTLIMLHFSMAGVFTFFFLRELKLSRYSSLIGAIIFAFCGAINTRRGHISVEHTLVWLPLLLYSYEKVTQTHRLRGICLLSLICTMQFLAGFIQGWVYSVLLLSLYMVYRSKLYFSKKVWFQEIALFWMITFALIAGQFVMTFMAATAVKRTSIPYDVFVSYSLPLKHLVTLINPFLFGMSHPGRPFKIFNQGYFGADNLSEFACYVGGLPLVASVYLFIKQKKPRQAFFWIAMGALFMVLSLGGFLPWFAKAVFHVPVLKSFRVPARFLFLFDFAAAVLAALCLNTLSSKEFGPYHFRWSIRAYCALVAVTTWSAIRVGHLKVASFELWTTPVFAFSLLLIGERFLREGMPRIRSFKIALMAFVIFDLWSFAFFNSNIFAPNNLSSQLAHVVRHLDPKGQYRILTIPGVNGDISYDSLGRDRNMIHGIRSTTGYTTFVPKTFMESLRCDEAGGLYDFEYLTRNQHMISALNTKWIIINNGNRLDPRYKLLSQAYPLLKTFKEYDIFENPEAMPLVFGVAKTIHSPSKVVDGFDYRNIAIIEDGQTEQRFFVKPIIRDIHQKNGQITATVMSKGDSFLVFSETYMRGWYALVDGIPTEITKTNGLLMGLPLPSGNHIVKLVFRPVPIYIALGFSLLSFLLVIGVIFSGWGDRRINQL